MANIKNIVGILRTYLFNFSILYISLLLIFGFVLSIGITVIVVTLLWLSSWDVIIWLLLIGVFFVVMSILMLFFIYDLPLIQKTDKRDDDHIRKEKNLMKIIVGACWIIFLFSITLALYVFSQMFLALQPMMNAVNFAISSGASGAFWALGMTEVARFCSWVEHGKNFGKNFDLLKKGSNRDWYSEKSFFYNLHVWKRRLVYSYILFSIVAFVIIPITDPFF